MHRLFALLFNVFILMEQIQLLVILVTNGCLNKNILRFPNLKSLVFTRCGSIEPVVQNLLCLIQHQLDELTLTFDEHVFKRFHYMKKHLSVVSDKGNRSFI